MTTLNAPSAVADIDLDDDDDMWRAGPECHAVEMLLGWTDIDFLLDSEFKYAAR